MSWTHSVGEYVLVLLGVLLATGVAWQLRQVGWVADPALPHRIAIVILALCSSLPAAIAGCALTILIFDWLYVPPQFGWSWTNPEYNEMFASLMVITVVISGLSQRLRRQKQVARDAAFRAEALYQFKVKLMKATSASELAELTSQCIADYFRVPVVVALRSPDGEFSPALDSASRQFAERACQLRHWVTEAGASGAVLWIPLLGAHKAAGVIQLPVARPFEASSELGVLLSACAAELVTALEQAALTESVQRVKLEAETERLRNSLLSVVSHDLKTPLAAIIGAGTTLGEHAEELSRGEFKELVSTIVMESERLHRIIQNLLSVTSLECPARELRKTPEGLDEILAAALRQLGSRVARERLRIGLPANLPLVLAEPGLVEQVFVNLLENAFRHAGPDARVAISAHEAGPFVAVELSDTGPGIPIEEREKVFDKFYRGRQLNNKDGSMGLGLTICRAIVRAHGGEILIKSREQGGTVVAFTLPAVPAVSVTATHISNAYG